MYSCVNNPDDGYYVCRFSLVAEDDDYETHVSLQEAWVDEGSGRAQRGALLIVHDSGYPPPKASIRQRVAALMGRDDYDVAIAVVTTNRVLFGLVSAIRWIRRTDGQIRFFRDIGQATEWLETSVSRALPGLRHGVKEVLGGTATEVPPT